MAVLVPRQTTMNVSLNTSLTCLGWLQKLGCRSGLQQPLTSPNAPATHALQPKQPAPPKKKPSKPGKKPWSGPTPPMPETLDPLITSWSATCPERPPHCYATLIYMAMRGKKKVTLGEIYSFVTSNFLYYRLNDNGWKNSIRHNLTQHNCFIKVQRTNEHPGKGGFWTLSPGHELMFKNGIFKRKRRKIPTVGSANGVRLGSKIAGKMPASISPKLKRRNARLEPVPYKSLITPQGNDGATRPVAVYGSLEKLHAGGSTLAGLLDLRDVMHNDDGEVLEGIDWDALVPDLPEEPLDSNPGKLTGTSGANSSGGHTTMMGALSLMDSTGGSPISIIPDVSQMDGRSPPPVEFTLNELHAELADSKMFGVHQEAMGAEVDSKLDVDANLSMMSEREELDDSGWTGDELTVIGTGLTLTDGIVPTMGASQEYHHVLLTDLEDFGKPIPVDWMI